MKSFFNQLLSKCSKMGSLMIVLCLAFSANAQKQSFLISGKISDSNGGIPGASIRIDGSTQGTSCDANGQFSFKADLNPGTITLIAGSVGYSNQKQVLQIGKQAEILVNFTLKEDVMSLDEVVVTGSTIKSSRRELGNAINSVSSDQLKKSGTNNLFGALQGKVPGAQITQNSGDPSGGMTIRLRGVKSIQGNSDPLYVIDGVIVSNASTNVSQTAVGNQIGGAAPGTNRMADINPADIETINIINGAAAAAQYGSRASNGVVLITTKRGKSGTPKISFTTSFNVSELRKKVHVSTYGKQYGWAGLRLHTIGAVSPASIAANNPSATFTPIIREGVATNLATNLVDVTRYDYQDDIFQRGTGTDNSVSISGGNDKTQYFTSISYMKNAGIVKGTDFNRYGLRARVDQRLNNWAKMTVGLNYTNSFANEKANGNVFYSPINSINITNNIYNIRNRDLSGFLQSVEPTRVNPLSTIDDMTFTQEVNRVINDFQLNLTPFKGLSIDWVVGIDSYSQLGKNLIKPYPYQAAAGLPAERYPLGYASNVNSSVFLFNSDLNIGYERQLSDKFKLNLIVGTNYQYQKADFSRANGENLAPFIETVSGASSTTVSAGYGLDQFYVSGMFAQATVGYKNVAFFTGAIRNDVSSKFSPNEKNNYYPKFSASFVPSDLDFWKDNEFDKIINGFKLRTSYGQAGNLSGIGSYDRFWQFSSVPYLGRNTILSSSTLANPNVRPELMTEMESGVDLSFLNNKVNLGITSYAQKISNLVVNRVWLPPQVVQEL